MDIEVINEIKAKLKLKFDKEMQEGNLSGAYAYMDSIAVIDVHVQKDNKGKAS
jgi:hypothetical protein